MSFRRARKYYIKRRCKSIERRLKRHLPDRFEEDELIAELYFLGDRYEELYGTC